MRKLTLIAASAGLLLAASPAASASDDVRCTGTIGAVEVKQVVVPEESHCALNGTTVLGNATVLEDATLDARDVDVRGSLQTQRAEDVILRSSDVRSNVQVAEGDTVTVEDSRIGADLQVTKQDGAVVLAGNAVGNNLQAQENRGGTSITANVIRVNLFCQDNVPPPTGGGNVVDGDAEKQCEDLAD